MAQATVKGGLYAQYGVTHKLIQDYRTITRRLAVSPVAITTPAFVGERVFDTNNNQIWQAVGALNTDWVALNPSFEKGTFGEIIA